MAAEAAETPQAVAAVASGASSGDANANANGDTNTNAKGSETAAGAAVTLETSVAGAATTEASPSATPTPLAPTPVASANAPAAAPAPVRSSPETVAALSAEIIKKADAKTTRFDVALTPDGLGKVDVRIEIGRDGVLTASMRFDTVHAAQELRGKANELRQALADAGFNVADNALSFDVSSQGGQSQNPFFAFEGWGDQGQRAFSGRAFQAALTGEEDITITPELLPGLKTVADSGLDIRI
ncbi:flagellar hook-length control protein FliK [Caulobacter vibrioides]|nr:flagellar hook-length control protein FliK [Caulobacter vibrioides]ATC26697.1 flagellar hook-length control protein FliK [Caulobacter vibrioides]PLR16034.1 flagellar hook-length control protein FliK [Caulobacter vibrioides]